MTNKNEHDEEALTDIKIVIAAIVCVSIVKSLSKHAKDQGLKGSD